MVVEHIRNLFAFEYKNNNFVNDKTGSKCIELIGMSFKANEPYIFGLPNENYIQRELDWYLSQSLNVNDIPGETPKIWKQVADKDGFVNSNYGWCIFSKENGYQYNNALNELKINPFSRRATMIYNRPSMWIDYKENGRNEFMCTFATQYFIRNNKLITSVIMRSNDSWAGYRNDYAWQLYVSNKLLCNLKNTYPLIELGDIIWNAGSLHLYEKQFYLVENYIETGKPYLIN